MTEESKTPEAGATTEAEAEAAAEKGGFAGLSAADIRAIALQPVILGLFALVSAGLLAAGHQMTAEEIRLRQAEDLLASLSQVIPGNVHDNDLLDDVLSLPHPTAGAGADPLPVYRARRGDAVTAVAFPWSGFGYGGEIRMLLGIDQAGRLLGVRVLQHAETPGLGDGIETAKSDWILAFDGRSLGDPPIEQWGVRKDGGIFDEFTGATITPRTVVNGVKGGLRFFAEQQSVLLAPPRAAPQDQPGSPAQETES